MPQAFTLLDDGQAHELQVVVHDARVLVPDDALHNALGWKLEDQGLCRGDVCIPVRDRDALATPEGLDLEQLAALWDRPLALDVTERAAALAEGAASRQQALRSLEAPDFTLPDLEGRPHTLSEHRGKKVLLIAYASW